MLSGYKNSVEKYLESPGKIWKSYGIKVETLLLCSLTGRSGQIVGERGGMAFPFRFWRGNAVPLAYTMTATYNTSNRKNVHKMHDLKLLLLSIAVTLNHAFCNLWWPWLVGMFCNHKIHEIWSVDSQENY